MSGSRSLVIVLLVLFAGQVALASRTIAWHDVRIPIAPAPSLSVAHALGLGDDQFFFRQGVLTITHAGTADGSVASLRDLDYSALVSWFTLLDRLDIRSSAAPVLAAYWYGYTPDKKDGREIVDYLVSRSEMDRQTGWRWLVEAVYLARYHLNDLGLALDLANRAAEADLPNAPFYVHHLPAFIELQLGQRDAALVLLKALLESSPDLPQDPVDLLHLMIERIGRADSSKNGGTDGA
jgi:hypothetical protein